MRLSRCRVKDSRGVLLYRELCCLLFLCSCFSVIAIVIKRCTPCMLAVFSAVLSFSLLCCVARLSNVTGPRSPLALLSCHRFQRSLTGWFSSVLVQPCPSFLWQELLQWLPLACARFCISSCVGTLCGRRCHSECSSLLGLQNAKADMCNDVFLLELLLPPACHPVLGECTSGGKMYTINIFVKYASRLVVLQYLQCDSSGYHPRGIGIFLAEMPVEVIRGVTWQLFSFHCSERWPLGSPPSGFVTFWFLSPFVTLLLKAVTLKGEGFLSSSYSSGITLGSGHLRFTCGSCACVPNGRCQSGGRRCTHTDYATCSAGLDSYTGS